MNERALGGKTAVITGNSRGIGRGISLALAEAGVNIVGNHSRDEPQANAAATLTGKEIEVFGVKSSSVTADIGTSTGRRKLLESALADYPEGVDYLILNAAGGLGKPLQEAKAINVDSQLSLVDEFLPHLKPGGAIVLLTSLWGQKYGEAQQMPGYESVANTKKMIERALSDRIGELDEKGLRLLIVCGHAVPGTEAFGYFMATSPDLIAEIKQTTESGEFPTTLDMGRATRDLILSGKPSGSIAYVGGEFVKAMKTERNTLLNKEAVADKLPMYSIDKLRVDTYESGSDPNSGISRYTLREDDCHRQSEFSFDKAESGKDPKKGIFRRTNRRDESEGHFIIDGEEQPVYRGVDLIKYAARAVFLQWKSLYPDSDQEPSFKGGESYNFEAMAFPGNRLTFYPEILSDSAGDVLGDCRIKVGDTVIAEIKGIKGKLDGSGGEGNTELIEAAAQALILTWMDKNPATKVVPVFLQGGDYEFYQCVSAGDEVTLNTTITEEQIDTVTGDCEAVVNGKVVARINGIKGQVLPGIAVAVEIIEGQRDERKAESKYALAAEA